MHFKSILTVYLPTITHDLEWEKEVSDKIVLAQSMPQEKSKHSFMRNIFLEEMRNIATTFGRELTPVICQTMERFNCYTKDKRYLEFDDRTDEYLEQYNETTTCIKFPDGRIVEEHTRLVWDKFIVKNIFILKAIKKMNNQFICIFIQCFHCFLCDVKPELICLFCL